jgi:hypothetical protein
VDNKANGREEGIKIKVSTKPRVARVSLCAVAAA